MKKQTLQLSDKMRDILTKYHNQVLFADELKELLQACKEAGLKFIPNQWKLPNEMPFYCDPEIPMVSKTGISIQKTIGLVVAEVKKVINSQIKEIEL